MTKKRRMFDIDLPAEEVDVPPPSEPQRRGPMATAITETGEASRQRAEVESAIRAENDALAHEFVRLKKLGLITDMIPVNEVRVSKLVRDRTQRRDLIPERGDARRIHALTGLELIAPSDHRVADRLQPGLIGLAVFKDLLGLIGQLVPGVIIGRLRFLRGNRQGDGKKQRQKQGKNAGHGSDQS